MFLFALVKHTNPGDGFDGIPRTLNADLYISMRADATRIHAYDLIKEKTTADATYSQYKNLILYHEPTCMY